MLFLENNIYQQTFTILASCYGRAKISKNNQKFSKRKKNYNNKKIVSVMSFQKPGNIIDWIFDKHHSGCLLQDFHIAN